MEGPAFARLLASWLSPGIVARAAEELMKDPSEAIESGQLIILSPKFDDPVASGYEKLASLFLAHFFVPPEVVRVAKLYRPGFAQEAWEPIAEVTFTGRGEFRELGTHEDGRAIVLRVSASITQMRLVQYPLEVLADIVGDLSRYWSRVRGARSPDSIHHNHRAEWTLLAWIDLVVAHAHGFHLVGPAGMTRLRRDYDFEGGGRFDSVRGRLPSTPEELEMLRVSASFMRREQPTWFDFAAEDPDARRL